MIGSSEVLHGLHGLQKPEDDSLALSVSFRLLWEVDAVLS